MRCCDKVHRLWLAPKSGAVELPTLAVASLQSVSEFGHQQIIWTDVFLGEDVLQIPGVNCNIIDKFPLCASTPPKVQSSFGCPLLLIKDILSRDIANLAGGWFCVPFLGVAGSGSALGGGCFLAPPWGAGCF